MKISAPVHVEARLGNTASRGELQLRYAAAYASTLLAVLATQPVIPTEVGFVLLAITLLGWPLSLALRARLVPAGVRLGSGRIITRLAVNSSVVILSAVAAFLAVTMQLNGLGLERGAMALAFGLPARTAISLLMEVFLIFACCRSLAILTDKDAVLCAVPSFSVLLLLLVVQSGDPIVVGYFLVWIFTTAALFALDHRAEARQDATGRVPSIVPGQDAAMSARGLASVMLLSLACASVLSTFLSSGKTGSQSGGDSLITSLASRLGALTLSLADASVNAGPERQIDFTSGPSLPTRAELWIVRASNLDTGRIVEPLYWRMFTYGTYDGRSWAQSNGSGTEVDRRNLNRREWPLKPLLKHPWEYRRMRRADVAIPTEPQELPDGRASGYALAEKSPDQGGASHAFGVGQNGNVRIRQELYARMDNVGFVPALPAPRAMLTNMENATVRVRDDYAVDAGVVDAPTGGNGEQLWSEVASPEYGGNGQVPKKTSEKPNPDAQLSQAEITRYTAPPSAKGFPQRVVDDGKRALRAAKTDDNNFARASLLLQEVQRGATYTLRPPVLPDNTDATDFFLHEGGKRGYCTYFAGALAVMCRTQGIPARVVTGFVSPEPLGPDFVRGPGYSLIRESMAHAWTEVWVPGWGWATLDATPSSDRGNNAPSFWDNALALLGTTLESGRAWMNAHVKMLLSLGALVSILALAWGLTRLPRTAGALGGFGWALSRLFGRGRDATPDEVARAEAVRQYEAAMRRLGRAFRPRQTWETPSEYLQDAEAHLHLPDWTPLRALTRLYERARYSPFPVSPIELAQTRASLARFAWKSARGKTL